ncbi:MAG: hypothetical protein M1834_008897 [Cirrosporium novae-zelandiae]|nr:MAG: hypothetical protein M1834_008897 [Cirrosporium novae-zelandiae]
MCYTRVRRRCTLCGIKDTINIRCNREGCTSEEITDFVFRRIRIAGCRICRNEHGEFFAELMEREKDMEKIWVTRFARRFHRGCKREWKRLRLRIKEKGKSTWEHVRPPPSPSLSISTLPPSPESADPPVPMSTLPPPAVSARPSIDVSVRPSIDVSVRPSIDVAVRPSMDVSARLPTTVSARPPLHRAVISFPFVPRRRSLTPPMESPAESSGQSPAEASASTRTNRGRYIGFRRIPRP